MDNILPHEQPPTILIVNTVERISGLMVELLRLRGYVTHTSIDIDRAAIALRNQPPDLIILGANIAGSSAFDFCREIKSNPLTELIPVIMLRQTDDPRKSDRVAGIEAGADDFFDVPMLAEEFLAVIRANLRRKRTMDRRLRPAESKITNPAFDAFISHASEDKDPFVRLLAQRLRISGIRIWYDEQELEVGDSLRETIERGLARSKYGIVILSANFFAKRWPQRELSGLAARESNGRKVILPVWLNLSFEDVERVAPMLADRIAARSEDGIDAVVQRLIRVIRPDLLPETTV